jgi:dsRNA-specific ribonuclease
LATLGADVLSYYTSEHLICHYPRLPMDVLFAAVAAYVGPKALAAITKEWGVDAAAEPGGEVDPGLLQYKRVLPGTDPNETDGESPLGTGRPNETMEHWRRSVSSKIVYDNEFGELKRGVRGTAPMPDKTTLEDASTNFVRALIGALYLHAGVIATKRFFTNHFLSRQLDLSSIFDFKYPTRDLSRLCLREGFEPPVACLISETGRLSRHPVFVVGVYSGRDKLGEGQGSSLDEARVRAAAAALKGWYLYSPMDVTVPSDAESGGQKKFKRNMVDCGEIIT